MLLEQIPQNDTAVVAPFFITEPLINLKRDYARILIDESVKPLPAYDQFDIKRGIIDLDRLYSEHRSSLLNYFVFNYLQQKQNCIRTFSDVVREYVNFVKEYGFLISILSVSLVGIFLVIP